VRLHFLPHGGDTNHNTDLDPKSAMARMRKQNHATLLRIRSLIAQTFPSWATFACVGGRVRGQARGESFEMSGGGCEGRCAVFSLLGTVVLTYGWHRWVNLCLNENVFR
jgi:hypothetical protein